jgi:hypothetical protein
VACQKDKNRQRYAARKEEVKARVKAYAQANPDKVRATHLRRYGLTDEQYTHLFLAQEGRCAICGADHAQSATTEKWLYVDHCHATGKVRGLLCNHCNRGLGAFQDKVEFLQNALAYLQRNP